MKYFIFIIFLVPTMINGQDISLTIDAGYGFQFAPRSIGHIWSRDGQNNKVVKSLRHSYGEGMNITAIIEYKLASFFDIGVGVSYMEGAPKVEHNISDNRITTYNSSMIRIMPEAKLNVPMDKHELYIRLGFIWGINGRIYHDIEFGNTILPSSVSYVYKGGDAYGVLSGMGYEYAISKHLSFGAELRLYSQTYGPRSKIMTHRVKDGVNIIENLTINQKEIEYKNKYLRKNYEDYDSDLPYPKLRVYKSFSSLGLNITFKYIL